MSHKHAHADFWQCARHPPRAAAPPRQGTLPPDACAEALERAIRQPRIAKILEQLRAVHELRVNPAMCDPTGWSRSPCSGPQMPFSKVLCIVTGYSELY
jgi:hypothetical protein